MKLNFQRANGSSSAKRRARPSVAPEDLGTARDLLLDWADRWWYDLAPVMLRMRNEYIDRDELSRALRFCDPEYEGPYVVKLLLRPATHSETGTTENNTRKAVASLRRASKEIQAQKNTLASLDNQIRKCDKLILELSSASSDFQDHERENFWRELQQRREALEASRTKERLLLRKREETLEEGRAQVAQREFVRLCKSELYALNPRSIANAMAGVPWMGWRQSVRRTRIVPCPVGKHRYYLAKTIDLLIHLTRSSQGDDRTIQFWIKAVRPSSSNVIAELRKDHNCDFLIDAINNVRDTAQTQEELPYVIAKEYLRIKEHPIRRDLLLREVAALRNDSALTESRKSRKMKV